MWLVLSVDLDFFCSSDTWIKRQNNGVAKTFNNKNQSWWISRFTVELKTSLRWWVFLVLECITDNTQGFWCIFCEYFWVHSEREDKDRIIEEAKLMIVWSQDDFEIPLWGRMRKRLHQKVKFNWINQFAGTDSSKNCVLKVH